MSEYKINNSLNHPVKISSISIPDERGFLMPLTDDIDPSLINRACFVGNFDRGVKRGIHYHKKEWKIYAVLTGAAKFVVVNIPLNLVDKYQITKDDFLVRKYLENNENSVKTFVISERYPSILIIPPWYANGWISLEQNTNVVFLSNLSFDQAISDDYRFNTDIVSKKYWSMGE